MTIVYIKVMGPKIADHTHSTLVQWYKHTAKYSLFQRYTYFVFVFLISKCYSIYKCDSALSYFVNEDIYAVFAYNSIFLILCSILRIC